MVVIASLIGAEGLGALILEALQYAAKGQGLGTQFLRHLSRTKVILHLVEVRPADQTSPLDNIEHIERELDEYSSALTERETWIVLTKIDEL